MPSSKKTPNLRLNKWLGSDKPKKDDFNEDNQIIDQLSVALREELAQTASEADTKLTAAGAGWKEQLEMAEKGLTTKIGDNLTTATKQVNDSAATLRSEMDAMKTDLTGLISTASGTTNTHTANSAIHVTAAQKTGWDQKGATVGAYTGNAATTRKITLGFAPSAGFVFAVGEPVTKTVWSSQSCNVWSAFFAAAGAGGGVTVQSDGFTVTHNATNSLEGFAYKLNENGAAYVYAVWR